MEMYERVSSRFKGVEGGLFSKVTKADVGDAFASMEGRVTLMGWADPFYPDPLIPPVVAKAMTDAFASGFPAHYTMPIGSPELRAAIAEKCRAYNCLDADPARNVLVTPGSDSGLYYALSVLLDSGDEVLVPDPSYPSNFLDPVLLGAKAVPVPLDAGHGYALDIEAFERAVTDRTKLVLLTHPNNPTTTVFSREELTDLASFVCRHELFLVVDQAFEDMIYDGREFVTPASLPGMWERTVTVCSVSKGMGLSGFRVGYLVACDRLMDLYYGAAVNVLGATNTASQAGALAAFRHPDFMYEYKRQFDGRRHAVCDILGRVPGVCVPLPQSGFFSWADVSALGDSTDIMHYLIEKANVAVNDGKCYGACGAGHLRIIHGCLRDDGQAEAALGRIASALMQYGNENES